MMLLSTLSCRKVLTIRSLRSFHLKITSFNTKSVLSHQSTFRHLSTQAAPATEEVNKIPPLSKVFQADTKKLLDIVAKSLYSDKEVFIRELISNASDAIERLRFLRTSGMVDCDDGHSEIHIETDELKKLLTIQDHGIGMTAEELENNLGTIAKSGSRDYVSNLKSTSGANTQNIIGQFGVGFYAAFMVADKVDVYSKTHCSSDASSTVGHIWSSDGVSGTYRLGDCKNVSPGTKIVLHLKDSSAEFCKEDFMESLIRKYSNFIGVPILLNGKQINVQQPLWLKDSSEITEDEYKSFYQFLIGNSFDTPLYRIFFQTDSPIDLRALLFIPNSKPSIFDASKNVDSSISLYSRKVLIMNNAHKLLPRWLRFVRGVVDSEDIPLNLSREMLQDHGLIRKINTILTTRILSSLLRESNRDSEKFTEFLADYGLYLKEGIVVESEQSSREAIAKLLRFESSALPIGRLTSFNEYASRMHAGERNIYFLSVPSRELAESSPYFEAIKKNKPDLEVLFLYEPYDELVLMNLGQYEKKNLRSIEQDLNEDVLDTNTVTSDSNGCLTQTEADALTKWAEETLGIKVKNVKVNKHLTSHPCLVSIREAGAMRHLLRTTLANRPAIEKYRAMEPVLELNPRHSLVRFLARLSSSSDDQDRVLAVAFIDYLLDVAMTHAGLLEEVRDMVNRSSQLFTLMADRLQKMSE